MRIVEKLVQLHLSHGLIVRPRFFQEGIRNGFGGINHKQGRFLPTTFALYSLASHSILWEQIAFNLFLSDASVFFRFRASAPVHHRH
jgi:hypothetical protein